MLRLLRHAVIALLAALALTGSAQAAGGDYVFDGGTAKEQAQVKAALDASSFDWNVVPVEITIHIERGARPHATPGDIWLDSRLLRSGRFSWGVVQHEYAHQVAFFLVGREQRAMLVQQLGAKDWCYEKAGFHHDEHACERFASMLAWAYWPSRHNTEKPATRHSESAAMSPAKFRALVSALVAAQAGQ